MTAPRIDRIVVEVSPGEIRAVAFAGDEAWDILFERPMGGAAPGDIYRARAGAAGPDGGRFFDLGDGGGGLARRPRAGWTDGGYGLVQVVRGEAGDKGPRVTDRVWLEEGGVAASLGASGPLADRIEIARAIPRQKREDLRANIAPHVPEGVAARVALGSVDEDAVGAMAARLIERLRRLAALGGSPRRAHAASGEVGRLVSRFPGAAWVPADLATAAWIAGLAPGPTKMEQPDRMAGQAIDAAIAEGLLEEAPLLKGARLWIEPTHALVACDVDMAASVERPAAVNRAAAREIARHLRLRRLGGIVAIDFLRDGHADGLGELAGYAGDDPWPWTPPQRPDPSGLVSFQRPRLAASLIECATGRRAAAYAGLRAAVRIAGSGGPTPKGLHAAPEVVQLLQTELIGALKETRVRLGAPLDLVRAEGIRSLQVIGANGEILDAV